MNYAEEQMLAVMPYPVDSIHYKDVIIQMRSEYGYTKWMKITPEEFRKIELILTGEEYHAQYA
jgi:hypothetical protein